MVAIPELDGAAGRWSLAGAPTARHALHRLRSALHLRVRRERPRHARLHRARRRCWRRASPSWSRCGGSERRGAQGRDRPVQFPAQCRQHRHRGLICRSSNPCISTLAAMKARRLHGRPARRVDALRERIMEGNAARFGAACQCPRQDSRRRSCAARHLAGRDRGAMGPGARPAAERRQRRSSCWASSFGNVFVGVQPAFGYEGDPMRLLFEKGFAPTHAFSAFYRWLREDFGAHAVLHFGTHGALEFMPGKQAGMSGAVLAGPADRRPAQPLSVCREQPVRRHASPSGGRRRR